MPRYNWLITGCSSGIGLALVQTLLKNEENFVIASARNPAKSGALQVLKETYPPSRLAIITLDVADKGSVTKAVEDVAALLSSTAGGLDYLVNNAGTNQQPLTTFEDLDLDLFQEEILFNTVSTVFIIKSFLPLIRKSTKKKIVMVSSIIGSLTIAPRCYNLSNSYGVSKAAFNMIARKWGVVLASEGITITVHHPGFVQTKMGDSISSWMAKHSPERQLTAEEAVGCLLKNIDSASYEAGTVFTNYDGSIILW